MTRRIILIGGSGLVGQNVTDRLRHHADVALTSFVRRPLGAGETALDFEQLAKAPDDVLSNLVTDGADIAISCLGTTLRKAGSQEAMYRIDHDYVAAFAKGARAIGVRHFILMSSVGAGGSGFYLKTKGAVEDAVSACGFSRVDIIRPGLLIGERSERRPAEMVAQWVLPWVTPLLGGSLARYGSIEAEFVAQAIVALTDVSASGAHIHENEDLRRLSSL